MILHIMPDEKIINRTISFFETSIIGGNKYIILLPQGCVDNTKVDLSICSSVRAFHYNSESFWSYVGDVDSYDKIVIHYLSYDAARFVNSIRHNAIYWIEWGADLYNGFLSRRGFKLYNEEQIVIRSKYPYLSTKLYRLFHFLYTNKQFKERYQAVKKIRYFVPDSMYDEYPLFLKYYPEFSHLVYKEFFYYPIDYVLGDLYRCSKVEGNNILIGNSCSYTNNHPYVFDLLYNRGVDDHIMVPLSYGGGEKYKQVVINSGKRLFGDKFHPIIDYMSLDAYNRLLLSCNSFIFGSLRQEAVGNILVALYIGGRVFLQAGNPLLHFYKSLGLIIFSFDDIEKSVLSKKLDGDLVNKNRQILERTYSSDRMKRLILSTFEGDDN